MILVVGATGQLGSLVVRRLRADGAPVRAMVRDPATAADLAATGAELAVADLRSPGTLDAALDGVTAVVATANSIAPIRPGDSAAAVDAGYAELIRRAERAGVSRVVVASVPVTDLDERVPVARSKRHIEQLLAESGMSWLSLRMPPFTEIWLALVGSSVPLRGESRATVARPYGFLRRFRRVTGRSIEDHGVMVLPGPASTRNAFISVHDAARVMVAAVDATWFDGPLDVGGPEVLTWTDVARIFGEVLGRPVRIRTTPVGVFTTAQRVLARVAPSASNVMGLNRLLATSETPWDTTEVARRLGVHPMRTVEQVLREKAALPAD